MNNKTLIKTKISLEDNGHSLVIYSWEKIFWIFGKWVASSSSTSNKKISSEKLKTITNKEVSKILFNKIFRENTTTKKPYFFNKKKK
jgi:hypothetical protein